MPNDAARAYRALRAADQDGGLPLDRREELLERLSRQIVERRQQFVDTLDSDFGRRSPEETLLAEILSVVRAARLARRHLRRWARPRRVGVPWPFLPTRAWIVPQPLGVVGIVSPWNYPVQLSLVPIVDALAAGNRVALKPSELTPRTAETLDALLLDALGADVARTVLGGAESAAEFVRQPFDHLLFTGSTARGHDVLRATSETLTPVTLELGGKCPAIVLADADLDHAASAIVRGKGLNAGQTCIAPDLLLTVGVDPAWTKEALRRAHALHFPNGLPTGPRSGSQAERIANLTDGAKLDPLGAEPCLSIATNIEPSSPLLRDEIFGPVLPVIETASLAAALEWVRARPSPLAVYLFTRSRTAIDEALAATRSGALVVNDTVVQAAMTPLPFGGVGASGFGRYHGKAGFDRFSNERILVRAGRRTLADLAGPPYGPGTRRLIERLLHV